jgi:hypothetical protein
MMAAHWADSFFMKAVKSARVVGWGVRPCARSSRCPLRDREQVLRTAVFRWDFRPATAGIEPGAVFHVIWRIKKRLFSPGGVANPRGTTRYRCGLRLARTKNPSFFICAIKRETLH